MIRAGAGSLLVLALAAGCGGPPPAPPLSPPLSLSAERPGLGAPEKHLCPAAEARNASESTAPRALRVVRVEIRGAQRPGALCADLSVRAGAELEPAQVDADVRALFRLGTLDDVAAFREDVPGGVALVYEVRERPRLAEHRIEGAPPELPADATRLDSFRPGDPIDPAALHVAAERLRQDLVDAGFRRAEVKVRTEATSSGEAAVTFGIEAGPRALVRAVRLEGVEAGRRAEISGLLRVRPGRPLVDVELERDALIVAAYYLDRGMIKASVEPRVDVSPEGHAVDVTLEVVEGPVFRVGKMRVAGALAADERFVLRKLVTSKPGDLVERSRLLKDMERIREHHRAQGAEVELELETELDPAERTVDVTLRLRGSAAP